MNTIAFLNRKGGVGKTSCVHHLAGEFAVRGHRVLLVDADPQASLTQGLLGLDAVRPDGSIVSAFAGYRTLEQTSVPVEFAGGRGRPRLRFDLVPGHTQAARHNHADPSAAGDDQTALRDWLSGAKYDLCLIDCPPNLQTLSRAALLAADGVVVPLQPEDYGAQGIAAVAREIAMVQAAMNPDVRLLGYLLTMVQRNSLHTVYAQKLRLAHGSMVFSAELPRATAFAEAVVARQPIAAWRPHGKPAAAIAAIAGEVLTRGGLDVQWKRAAA
jgi:chromosome partitioning protein